MFRMKLELRIIVTACCKVIDVAIISYSRILGNRFETKVSFSFSLVFEFFIHFIFFSL